MNKFKNQLDKMMGDTDLQEKQIKKRVHERMNSSTIKRSWSIPLVTTALVALSFFLFITMNPLEQVTTEEGRYIPYDPLDDMVTISTLHKKKLLSTIDYEQLATLPLLESLSSLQYVDRESFTINNDDADYHTVIERQSNLFDEVVYEPGDVIRTMTNTNSHLPIFNDTYYEVVAVPGDRIVLRDGKLMVNGKKLSSALIQQYEQNGNTILGSYEQSLNAREYFLLNHFPAEQTLQAGTITPVHKIFGEVVGLAKENYTDTIYFGKNEITNNGLVGDYTPEDYFDLYLYDAIFGEGEIAQNLTVENTTFPHSNRQNELFLEAAYRKVTYLSDEKVEIRYQYGREGINEYTFYLYKMPNSTTWKLGSD